MAKKKLNLEMTPLMTLSALAIFAMMPILISITNNQQRARASRAAEIKVQMEKPSPVASPTTEPKQMMYK